MCVVAVQMRTCNAHVNPLTVHARHPRMFAWNIYATSHSIPLFPDSHAQIEPKGRTYSVAFVQDEWDGVDV